MVGVDRNVLDYELARGRIDHQHTNGDSGDPAMVTCRVATTSV